MRPRPALTPTQGSTVLVHVPWAVVIGIWGTGWYLALQASQQSLILEPTDDALRAAADSIPKGLAGCVIGALAALCGAALTRRLTWLWLCVPPGVVALALLGEPDTGGWALIAWLAGTVAAAVASGALALTRAAKARKAPALRATSRRSSHPSRQ